MSVFHSRGSLLRKWHVYNHHRFQTF